jgi:hypothetical protein
MARYPGGGPPEKEDAGGTRHLPRIKTSSNERHDNHGCCAKATDFDDGLAGLTRHLATRHSLRASVAAVVAQELRAQAAGGGR